MKNVSDKITTSNYIEVYNRYKDMLPDKIKATHDFMLLAKDLNWGEGDTEMTEMIDFILEETNQFFDEHDEESIHDTEPNNKVPSTPQRIQEEDDFENELEELYENTAINPEITNNPELTKEPKATKKATAPKPKKAAATKKAPIAPVSTPSSNSNEPTNIQVLFIRRFVAMLGKTVPYSKIVSLLRELQKAILEKQIRKNDEYAFEIENLQNALIQVASSREQGDYIRLVIDKKAQGKYMAIAGGEKEYLSVKLLKKYVLAQGRSLEMSQVKALNNLFQTQIPKLKATDPMAETVKAIGAELSKLVKSRKEVLVLTATKQDLNGIGEVLDGCDCQACKTRSLHGIEDISGTQTEANNVPEQEGQYAHYIRLGELGILGSLASSTEDSLNGLEDFETSAYTETNGIDPRFTLENGLADSLGRSKTTRNVSETPEIVSKQGRNVSKQAQSGSKIMSSGDLMKLTYSLIPLSAEWKDFLGEVEKGFRLMVHGKPGQGKSTFCIKLAKELAKHGKVLFVTAEQYGSKTLQDNIARNGGPGLNLDFSEDFRDVNLANYQHLFIDSIQVAKMTLEDLRTIKSNYPNLTIVLVAQSTKAGEFKGGQDWSHEVDIVIKIEAGIATQEKNRYGTLAEMQVF